jgi:glycosyltransferase involved in cell wall biosynthesis
LIDDPLASGVYPAADVVCQLSRWQEAFGWMIAEAMACSRPVVATRVGGIPELVEDGISGYLVNRRQPAEAADRILRLLEDRELRHKMGTSGRRAVETRFNLQRNVAQLLELYGIADGFRSGSV